METQFKDKIGRKEIVDRICSLVDSLKKDRHFCLSLNGSWGSGKSFVLNMIAEKLLTHCEYTVIRYDAWENTFYSDPLIAILSCIIDGIQDKIYFVENPAKQIKNAAVAAVNAAAKVSSKVKFLKDVVIGIKRVMDSFKSDIKSEKLDDFKSYRTLLNETKAQLNKITEFEEFENKQSKLIILVDEIDRCLPSEQLQILERLHHLLNVKNCAVICAVNKPAIVNNFRTTFGGSGNEYLRKFFEFNFNLDSGVKEFLTYLICNDLLIKVEKVSNGIPSPARFLKYCNSFLQSSLSNNIILQNVDNRRMNNYFNSVLSVIDGYGWENINQYNLFFIVIGMFIKKFIYPEFLQIKPPDEQLRPPQAIFDYVKYLSLDEDLGKKVEDRHSVFYVKDFLDEFNIMSTCLSVWHEVGPINGEQAFYDENKIKNLVITFGGQDETDDIEY